MDLGGPAQTDRISPALRQRIRTVLGQLPSPGTTVDDAVLAQVRRLVERDAAPWAAADPALAELGEQLLDPRYPLALRCLGATWLAWFPTEETALRLAQLTAPATPPPLRAVAIRGLADRQLRDRHPATAWPVKALHIADEALYKLADATTTEGTLAGDALAHALRHVQADALGSVYARAPALWGAALEAFATPPLARVLVVSIDDIAPEHRVRALRLIAATLGEEAAPLLVARAAAAASEERLEALLLAVAVGGEARLGALEDAVRSEREPEPLRARARWHLAHRGVVPTVRGLRVARVTATLSGADRAAACAQAADDLGALTAFARHAEDYVYALWGWMVRGASDPRRAGALVAAHPESQRLVRELYLADLARRGQVRAAIAAAHALGAEDHGALQLAIHGRPLAALELAAGARTHTAELVCARALGCYRAGRPDLAARVLAEDLPPAESGGTFPGAHERWLVAEAPRAPGVAAIATLARGLAAIVGLAQPAPGDAEPDRATLDPIAAVERRLARDLTGAVVYAGSGDREKLAATLARRGARLVAGPLPETTYYIAATTPRDLAIQLERHGARALTPAELDD